MTEKCSTDIIMGYLKSNVSNTMIVHKTEAPAGQHVVVCTALALAAGDEPRVFAAITAEKDAIFAQCSIADALGILALFERINGTEKNSVPHKRYLALSPAYCSSLQFAVVIARLPRWCQAMPAKSSAVAENRMSLVRDSD